MARMRVVMVQVECPVCGEMHATPKTQTLFKFEFYWTGWITRVYCAPRGMEVYKLYGECFDFVCWQQNFLSWVPDHDEIPF